MDIALSSFRTFSNKVPQHLSKGEFDALKNLKTNKSSFKKLITTQEKRIDKIYKKLADSNSVSE